jgi:hypothetical protein
MPGFQGQAPRSTTRFPSGKLFAQLANFNTYKYAIIEVVDEGYRFIRDVEIESILYPDFSLRWKEVRYGGFLCSLVRYCLDPLAENPEWGPPEVLDSMALATKDNPHSSTLGGEVTGSGRHVSWDGSLRWDEEDGFHLLLFQDGKRMMRGYRRYLKSRLSALTSMRGSEPRVGCATTTRTATSAFVAGARRTGRRCLGQSGKSSESIFRTSSIRRIFRAIRTSLCTSAG